MHLKSNWPRPSAPRPIVILGAGGIIQDAHLPAYRKANFPVAGIFDINPARSAALAKQFNLHAFSSIKEATSTPNALFDLAVPPEHIHDLLTQLPSNSAVLIQKPLGVDLADARRIATLCRAKNLTAAVNFQLRFSPMMLALRDALSQNLLGDLLDLELRINARTPWEIFPFLEKLDRVEILVHSIHYLDWIRSLLGEPSGVYARTVGHPFFPKLTSCKSSIILDYGNTTRCCLTLNHNYQFGPQHEAAYAFLQGTKGAALITMGLTLGYPHGKPETVELATLNQPWTQIPIEGRWFPDAFLHKMSHFQRYLAGEDPDLIGSVDDALHTMALVEACYTSDAQGATPIPPAAQLPSIHAATTNPPAVPYSQTPVLVRLDPNDNIAALTASAPAGTLIELGDLPPITLRDAIAVGHKVALRDIATGEKITKFGCPIGSATRPILAGQHVHTHNLKSDYLPTFTLDADCKYLKE